MKTIYHESLLLWLLTLGLLLSLPFSIQAREIYKWVDSNGVTHFSQAPPEQTETNTEIIQLEETQPETKPEVQAQSILEIANQFERARLAREKARFDRRLSLARFKQETERDELEQDNSNNLRYVPIFYPRFKHHHKHKHKHRKSKRCYPHCGKGRDKHKRKKHNVMTKHSRSGYFGDLAGKRFSRINTY